MSCCSCVANIIAVSIGYSLPARRSKWDEVKGLISLPITSRLIVFPAFFINHQDTKNAPRAPGIDRDICALVGIPGAIGVSLFHASIATICFRLVRNFVLPAVAADKSFEPRARKICGNRLANEAGIFQQLQYPMLAI